MINSYYDQAVRVAGWRNRVSRKACKLDGQPVVNSTVLLKAVVNILQSCLVK